MRWGATLLQTSLPVTLACSRAMVEADFRAEMKTSRPHLIVTGRPRRSMPVELTANPPPSSSRLRLLVYRGAPHGLFSTWESSTSTLWRHAPSAKPARPPPEPAQITANKCN